MAKIYLKEKEIAEIKQRLLSKVDDQESIDDINKLMRAVDMGIMAHRVIFSMKPLITAIWKNLNESLEPSRFAVDKMLKDMDEVLSFWAVPDSHGRQDENEDTEPEDQKIPG